MIEGDMNVGPKKKDLEEVNIQKKTLTLDDTITSFSDESIPRRYRNPISQRWDDTTWI
jgi:hypothetical protein